MVVWYAQMLLQSSVPHKIPAVILKEEKKKIKKLFYSSFKKAKQ